MKASAVTLCALIACGDNRIPLVDATITDTALADAALDAIDAPLQLDAPAIDADPSCASEVIAAPLAAGTHVTACSPVVYATNPPTSGSHYPSWATFQTYATAIPRGFWVHSLEHGAVVISYNCPAGCDADLAALATMIATLPVDPMCVAPLERRIIVTPDPLLDTKFAASAWGFALKSTCFDLAALGVFIHDHYAHATENFCSPGIDPTSTCP